MKKPLKALFSIAALIVIGLVLALAYVLLVLDPNAYKPQIASVAAGQGIDLEIQGDLSWTLFPNLAIRVGQTRLESEQHGIPEASFRQADLVLSWGALLRKQIAINALEVDGANLTLQQASQGAAIAAAPASADAPVKSESGDVSLAVQRLALSNSRITLPGEGEDGATVLENLNLNSQSVSLAGAAFPIDLAFDYTGPLSEQPVNIVYRGEARFTQTTSQLDLPTNTLTVSGLLPEPLSLSFGLSTNLESGTLDLSDLEGELGPVAFSGEVSAENITGQPAFAGSLAVPAFDAKTLLNQWFDAGLKTADQKALTAVGISTDFAGTLEQVSLDNLQLALDQTTFTGNLRFGLGQPRTLQMTLKGGALAVDRYLAPASATSTDKDSAAPQNAAAALFAPLAAPLALLDGGRGQIDFNLESLTYDKTRVDGLHTILAAEGRKISVRELSGKTFGGSVNATANLNLGTEVPVLDFKSRVENIDLEQALAQAADSVDFTGLLTADVQGRTRGNSQQALMDNLQANGNFRVEDPVLTTINVEKSYCEVAALVEKREKRTEPWPASTHLDTLEGNFRIADGVLRLESYRTGVGNLKLRGDGDIDLNAESFNIMLVSNLQGERTSADGCIVKSKRIRNRDIPIRCRDTFADAGAGSCKPDQAFVNQVIQKEVMDKIKEKTGLDESSSEALEGLLRGFLGGGNKDDQ